MYTRLHATRGIVVLAFYDLRDAAKAKTSIETGGVAMTTIDGSVRQDGILDDRDTDMRQSWETRLTCRLITPRDLRTVCKINKIYSQF